MAQDKTLVCRDCGNEFIFTAGEQEFYASRGLKNEPKRCPACRSARRSENRGEGGERRTYEVVCAACGVQTTVPFEPTEGRPVYCKDCYAKTKESEKGVLP
ncbi:zinc-ribbon domain containing protein [Dehalococcoides mccartyi]|uniref:zinc-ribbon domain containing protein n=1 Tax=Dehalococcoides mccartyi TaxID=61435 RepID=UPI003D0B4B0B